MRERTSRGGYIIFFMHLRELHSQKYILSHLMQAAQVKGEGKIVLNVENRRHDAVAKAD
jgi:hypothetical protein